ncbi:hypothetical protein FOA43_001533 [Brettanomyces nanus]|uniref:Uncharacterized protein n=1 Tax=Eeniella nana TaxID=13502 RepID=A0A875S322_EENNA|nr:uncharacterized protein FOA43_001533 [Brettanomyces nanus]QPG74209.1 hypothetical protein FOA43_001533 [Brettanomyces nanus]
MRVVSGVVHRFEKLKPKMSTYIPRYYDVGMNFSDDMFRGIYRDKPKHHNDMDEILQRAKTFHVEKMLLTGSSLMESRWTLQQALKYKEEGLEDDDGLKMYPQLAATVGVHPCTVMEFEDNPESHLSQLRNLITEYSHTGLIRAIGEIGLDYDRLNYAPADKQRVYFELQLKLACEFDLPLFLHMRSACDDFLDILIPFIDHTRDDGLELKNKNCLVHSFSGTSQDLDRILQHKSLRVSVNGCSLKTEENCRVASQIPLERLLLETDAPWCEIKRTHWSYQYLTKCPSTFYPVDYNAEPLGREQPGTLHDFLRVPVLKPEKLDQFFLRKQYAFPPLVKGRNEPCMIGFVAQVMSRLKNCDPDKLIEACYKNSEALFG